MKLYQRAGEAASENEALQMVLFPLVSYRQLNCDEL